MTATAPDWLKRGIRVWDSSTGREGLINGIGNPFLREERPSCLWLLPPGGGHEWRTTIEAVRPIEDGDREQDRRSENGSRSSEPDRESVAGRPACGNR